MLSNNLLLAIVLVSSSPLSSQQSSVLDCKNFTIQCDNWCNDRLCTIGPDMCRKGGECASEYHCDGSNVAPEGSTETSTSARDVEPATGIESQDTEELTQGVPPSDQETSPETKCIECYRWLKNCEVLECRGPSTSTCRQHCQARLCTQGPATCRKGGACGSKNGCGGGQLRPPPPVPSSPDAKMQVDNIALSARSEPEPDQTAGCPSCNDWIRQCKRTSCSRPWDPNCQWDCMRRLCKDGPNECRKGGSCSQCGKAVTKRVDPVENDQTASCPSCVDWIKQCRKAHCARPWDPNCQWDCQRRFCKDGPNECRKGGSCFQCR